MIRVRLDKTIPNDKFGFVHQPVFGGEEEEELTCLEVAFTIVTIVEGQLLDRWNKTQAEGTRVTEGSYITAVNGVKLNSEKMRDELKHDSVDLESYGLPSLQTWEYSPEFGLRSYVYTYVYATVAWLFSSIIPGVTKPMVFYAVRACNASFCALCEYFFSKMISSLWGTPTAAIYLYLSAALPGLYERGLSYTLTRGAIGLLIVCGTIVAVDYHFYGRVVFAPLNIAMYNFGFSVDNLSQLYGVEPWYYYIFNGILNFNICLPLAFISILYFTGHKLGSWLPVGFPMMLWFGIMSKLAHKEERFLYPIYPCIAACSAAVLVKTYPTYTSKKAPTQTTKLRRYAVKSALAVIVLLSTSRIAALRLYYGAPAKVWEKSYNIIQSRPEAVVCMGDDWYRSYSHFFMPPGARLEFTK
ncbi:glycosyltransferase, putative [Perkinsus marinus ATCC 50983]|uniref:Mannosyltransferase n=1 Tax=Perkinsus marinus (strain ATCC 50983 / TXsc) TaxID=423536 RepID=C5KY36_PERM5|nr:glycosyltransferase, putative [Perkinsus marinus ATCC 50983]EER10643.1 glycosyltransferase, putative [Perkinsus marinus ATCC 50983]|eukprot:XP_002778848.1 glycosyltransferase, putative [Perkinsus marinus ATCC 50983]